MSKLADNILDALTSGEHSKQLKETETVRSLTTRSIRLVFSPNFQAYLIHEIALKVYTVLYLFEFFWAACLNLLLIIISGFDWMICFPQDNLPIEEPAEKVDATDDAEVKHSHILRIRLKCLRVHSEYSSHEWK